MQRRLAAAALAASAAAQAVLQAAAFAAGSPGCRPEAGRHTAVAAAVEDRLRRTPARTRINLGNYCISGVFHASVKGIEPLHERSSLLPTKTKRSHASSR